MKIYFAGSIRGGCEDSELYSRLIDILKGFGEVLTEHVGSTSLNNNGESGLTDTFIHDRDLSWILESDVVVAEVTAPSLGVGYEVGRAIENGKKVICFYRRQEGKAVSAMIAGCPDLTCKEYGTEAEFGNLIREYLS
jgi:2'-deoxynucleoside 5'-phosphate N-hydrolase